MAPLGSPHPRVPTFQDPLKTYFRRIRCLVTPLEENSRGCELTERGERDDVVGKEKERELCVALNVGFELAIWPIPILSLFIYLFYSFTLILSEVPLWPKSKTFITQKLYFCSKI